jgi:ABC-type transport system involved in multi-copper enzyme maturation permease subunit
VIWTVARKEMAHHLLSFRFGVAVVLCSLVVLVSCLGMYRQYDQRAQDYALTQARPGEPRANIPPALMSVFAWGLEDVTGRTVDLTQGGLVVTHALRSPLNIFDAFFSTLDLSYVIRMVGALVALMFTFDAICGEGRGGTLALSLAAGASRRHLLLGKLAGGFPVVAVLFAGPVVLGLVLMAVLFSAPVTLSLLARALLWAMGTGLYLFCFFCLGLWISSIVTTPKVSLMACLVVWTLLIFVAPTAVVSMVRVETHLQSPVRFEQVIYLDGMRIRSGADDPEERAQAVQELFQRRQARAGEMLAFADRTLERLRVFPGAAYVDLSANLAGTGVVEMPRYYSAINRYVQDVQAARQQGIKVPALAFARSGLGACVQGSVTDAISLVSWGVAALCLAFVAFSRYDVRVKEGVQG